METPPPPEPEPLPLKGLAVMSAAGLLLLALIPKRGEGEGLAAALGLLEIVLLVALSVGAALPRIKRANFGCLVQIFLAVTTVTLGVVGSILLVIFTCVGAGGIR